MINDLNKMNDLEVYGYIHHGIKPWKSKEDKMKIFDLPTGKLFTDTYEKGELETLSIGDYGKQHNIKADFLGFTKEINGVPNMETMPLSEKWVITLSTQYGCAMNCTFCDVPNIKYNGNVSFEDLKKQLYSAISLYPNVKYTDRLNIHFARMGEPIFNKEVFKFAWWLYKYKQTIQEDTGLRIETLHPVLTTMLPNQFKHLEDKLNEWCEIKNELYNGQAGLQLSINSTDEEQRNKIFNKHQLSLRELSRITNRLPDPIGRKYCLNFAYSTDFIVDAQRLVDLFDPNKFMCKITPIHNNNSCARNNIKTDGGYYSYHPYRQVEEDLKEVGFDALVFVPSMDEENGCITCGNAILGGSKLNLENMK